LLEEITERFVPVPVGPQLQSTSDLLVALYAFQDQRKEARQQTAAPATLPDKPGQAPQQGPQLPAAMRAQLAAKQPAAQEMAGAITKMVEKLEKPSVPYLPQQILMAEADARFNGTIRQPLIGFGERLAMFWANHFAVATSKSEECHILAGAFEREAIRPHVFGRFADMLLAVETHPAMLGYLDNQQSIGPNSKANANKKRGLNENLARETLELHTLGVNGGYTQTDVTTLAKIITGWTVARAEGKLGAPGPDFARPDLWRQRRRAGAGSAARPCPSSRNRAAYRHQACPAFHRRRPATGTCAGGFGDLHQDGRRPFVRLSRVARLGRCLEPGSR
jgi:uncharacterized protein (DUF1800 family)